DDHPDVKTIIIGGGEAWDGPDPANYPFAITDAGFAHIANCKRVEKLAASSFHPLQVTDDGLKALKGLANLRVLDLGSQRFTDAGMAHLSGLTSLEELWLDFARQVGDGTLQSVSNMKKLRVLRFYGAPISDAGIAKIKNLTELEDLQLGRSRV